MKTKTEIEFEGYKKKLLKEAKEKIIHKRRIKIFYFIIFTAFAFFVTLFLLLKHKDNNFEDISESSRLILLSIFSVSFIFIIIELIVLVYASRFSIKREKLIKVANEIKLEKLTVLQRSTRENEIKYLIIKKKFEEEHIKNWKEIHRLNNVHFN